jgi:hypothetical protein
MIPIKWCKISGFVGELLQEYIPRKQTLPRGVVSWAVDFVAKAEGKSWQAVDLGKPWENGDVASWFCGTSQDEFREL